MADPPGDSQADRVLFVLRAYGGTLTAPDGLVLGRLASLAKVPAASLSTLLYRLEQAGEIVRVVRGRRCYSVSIAGQEPLAYEDGLADAVIRLVRAGYLGRTEPQIIADAVGVSPAALYRARDRTSGHRANGRERGRLPRR